jgi:6-phosphofructokinase
MPWTAIPFNETAKKDEIVAKYDIEGMPALVIIGRDGTVKSTEGRDEVVELGAAAFQKWIN